MALFLFAGFVTIKKSPADRIEIPLAIRVIPKGDLSEWTDASMDEAYRKTGEGVFSKSFIRTNWKNTLKRLNSPGLTILCSYH